MPCFDDIQYNKIICLSFSQGSIVRSHKKTLIVSTKKFTTFLRIEYTTFPNVYYCSIHHNQTLKNGNFKVALTRSK